MASKIAEVVRNSPLLKKRMGGYSPVAHASEDPFAQGITFHVHFMTTVDIEDRVGTDRVQDQVSAAVDKVQKSKKPMRKVAITVRSVSLTVADMLTKAEIRYPIYLVSYCGNSRDVDAVFFFIHKSKVDKKLRAEVFKCSDSQKVEAMTRTLSKAFNIAYKAWQMKKRQQARDEGRTNSPLLQKRDSSTKDAIEVTKAAGATGGYYSPQLRSKSVAPAGRPRSGSFDKDKEAAAMAATAKNPALSRLKVQNEATGSTHDVTVTDEFDEGFQDLAMSRHHGPATITPDKTTSDPFKFDDIKQHLDNPAESGDEPLIQF